MEIRRARPSLNILLVAFLFTCLATFVISFLEPQISRRLATSCWLGFLVLLMVYLSQYPKIGLIILISCLVVGLGFVLPRPVATWALDYPNAILDYFGFTISAGKIFHIIVYGFVGAGYAKLVVLSKNWRDKFMLTVAVTAAMVMSEVFQLYVPNRSSTLKDVSYNAIGLFIGVVAIVCVCKISLCNRRKRIQPH